MKRTNLKYESSSTDTKSPDAVQELIEWIRPQSQSRILLINEHGGQGVPPAVEKNLGLCDRDWNDHISHDIGTRWLSQRLSQTLRAETAISRYSRLWVDLNRKRDDATVIRQIYDQRVIAANCNLNAEQKEDRLRHYFDPFHEALSQWVAHRKASNSVSFLCTIHSFTSHLRHSTFIRPWHISILSTPRDHFARRAHSLLKSRTHRTIGFNEPYRGDDEFSMTTQTHGVGQEIPNFSLEIRNDLLQDKKESHQVVSDITKVLEELLSFAHSP